VSKNSSFKPVVLFVAVTLVLAGLGWFMTVDHQLAIVPPKIETTDKAEQVNSTKPASPAVTSTQSTASNDKAKPTEKVVQPRWESEPSKMRETADPNDDPDNALAGISFRNVEMWEMESLKLPEKLKGGVLISKIHAKSSFAESQVRPGDIVTRAHHTTVVTFTDLENAVKDRTHTLLDLYRNGKPYQVVLNEPFNPK